MKAAVILLFSAIFSGIAARAASQSDSTVIYFHQGKWTVDNDYEHNRARLDSLVDIMDADSTRRIEQVRVVGGASPEGSVAINRRLSYLRARQIFDRVNVDAAMPDSVVKFDFIGRDWEGLYSEVLRDTAVPYRSEVLQLVGDIEESINSGTPDGRNNLLRLQQLRSGVPYRYLYLHQFPRLRASRLYVSYQIPKPSLDLLPGRVALIEWQEIEPAMPVMSVATVQQHKPFYMALKTNMLYDAALLPNIGAEFYIGKNWSVEANWIYAWWDQDSRHRYWRAYGGDVGVRRWFGRAAERKPLTGHHLGLFAGVVTYDFELGGQGYMGGLPGRTLWDRCNLMAGVSYGYSLPVGRRINIDFTIGIGYLGGKYIKYVPEGSFYKWQSTNRLNWFGPIKAEISLVWLIGRGNYNENRGGIR